MNHKQQKSRWWQVVGLMAMVAAFIFVVSQVSGDPQAEASFGARGLEWPEIALEEVVSGLSDPVQVTHAGDGSGRLFIVQQGGQIRIYEDGALLETPFLSLSTLVSCCAERGLLGLAFSPTYSANGEFYVNYTDTNGDTQVVRYHVSDDANVADANSAQIVLTVEQDFVNHNGGQIVFGPDDYLYIGMGDGGSGGDPNNRAQDPTQLLGKMLRIDVETDNPSTYTIPPDNPYVDDPDTENEIWALGLRNPWRFSFDRLTGDMYIGDVGQNQWEEINFQPAESAGGENYGWRCYEGNHAFDTSGCEAMGDYDFPVIEYSSGSGSNHCSVTGGFVYRGTEYPAMQGIYFYSDYCTGTLWGLQDDGMSWQNEVLGDTGRVTGFGEDEAGNLYLVTSNGILYELVDATSPPATPTPTVVLKETIYLPILRR